VLQTSVWWFAASFFQKKLEELVAKSLREYAEYVERGRRYAREMSLDQAVDRAIDECVHKGILAEFLEKNKAEVKKWAFMNMMKKNICVWSGKKAGRKT